MIANPIFNSFIPSDITETLRSVGNEFDSAERQNNVSADLGRKYHGALRAYENALGDCPYSPGSMIIEPTAHDGMMREKMREELSRVNDEGVRILNHFGGALALTADENF